MTRLISPPSARPRTEDYKGRRNDLALRRRGLLPPAECTTPLASSPPRKAWMPRAPAPPLVPVPVGASSPAPLAVAGAAAVFAASPGSAIIDAVSEGVGCRWRVGGPFGMRAERKRKRSGARAAAEGGRGTRRTPRGRAQGGRVANSPYMQYGTATHSKHSPGLPGRAVFQE